MPDCAAPFHCPCHSSGSGKILDDRRKCPQRGFLRVPAIIAKLMVRSSHYWNALCYMASNAPALTPSADKDSAINSAAYEVDTSIAIATDSCNQEPNSLIQGKTIPRITSFVSNSTLRAELFIKATVVNNEFSPSAPAGTANTLSVTDSMIAEGMHAAAIYNSGRESKLSELTDCRSHKTETCQRDGEKSIRYTHFNTKCDAVANLPAMSDNALQITAKMNREEMPVRSPAERTGGDTLLPLVATAAAVTSAPSFINSIKSKSGMVATSALALTGLVAGGRLLWNSLLGESQDENKAVAKDSLKTHLSPEPENTAHYNPPEKFRSEDSEKYDLPVGKFEQRAQYASETGFDKLAESCVTETDRNLVNAIWNDALHAVNFKDEKVVNKLSFWLKLYEINNNYYFSDRFVQENYYKRSELYKKIKEKSHDVIISFKNEFPGIVNAFVEKENSPSALMKAERFLLKAIKLDHAQKNKIIPADNDADDEISTIGSDNFPDISNDYSVFQPDAFIANWLKSQIDETGVENEFRQRISLNEKIPVTLTISKPSHYSQGSVYTIDEQFTVADIITGRYHDYISENTILDFKFPSFYPVSLIKKIRGGDFYHHLDAELSKLVNDGRYQKVLESGFRQAAAESIIKIIVNYNRSMDRHGTVLKILDDFLNGKITPKIISVNGVNAGSLMYLGTRREAGVIISLLPESAAQERFFILPLRFPESHIVAPVGPGRDSINIVQPQKKAWTEDNVAFQNFFRRHLPLNMLSDSKEHIIKKCFGYQFSTKMQNGAIVGFDKSPFELKAVNENFLAGQASSFIEQIKSDYDVIVKSPNELLARRAVYILGTVADHLIISKLSSFTDKMKLMAYVSLRATSFMAGYLASDSNEQKESILNDFIMKMMIESILPVFLNGQKSSDVSTVRKMYKKVISIDDTTCEKQFSLNSLIDQVSTGKLSDKWKIKNNHDAISALIDKTQAGLEGRMKGVYTVLSEAGEAEYYIRQNSAVYHLRWDEYANTWRVINPDNPSRWMYAVPIKLDNGKWVVHADLPGKGGWPKGLPQKTSKATMGKVKKEFILEKHIKPLEEASLKSNFAVSFRKAGKPTLDCLKDGAGAKPHSILEKTIKESSLKKYYSENYSEVAAKIKNANIEGLVGHWDNEKGLVGLYLTTNEEIESELIAVGEHVVYPIDMSSLEGSLANLKRVKNWKSRCYTGDYDTHDVIIFNGAGRPRKVLSDSLEEQSVIKILNDAVEKVDAPRRHISHTHRVIQHGPQVNYPSHMIEFERAENKPLVPAVANPGEFPIMMLDRGKWILIENKDELAEYYKNVGAVIKDGWSKNPSVTYTEQGIKPGGSSGH
ncbi:hypothetical protein [Erwinia mallotivora]|uniref:hypothetical protein n=1 Tax=Erwinia mallotivora TaxID=69222 RepID=UPI0021BF8FFB|nr:hypothetical protein [Erwinia mallotivora]